MAQKAIQCRGKKKKTNPETSNFKSDSEGSYSEYEEVSKTY